MTGPAPGKIPLSARVYLCSKTRCVEVECDVYLHVKGWSLARVTHLDLEAPLLNEAMPPVKHAYCPLKVDGDKVIVRLREPTYSRELGMLIREIRVESEELAGALGDGASTWVYLGGKEGGVFLGFRKEFIVKLEELARSRGVEPRGSRLSRG